MYGTKKRCGSDVLLNCAERREQGYARDTKPTAGHQVAGAPAPAARAMKEPPSWHPAAARCRYTSASAARHARKLRIVKPPLRHSRSRRPRPFRLSRECQPEGGDVAAATQE